MAGWTAKIPNRGANRDQSGIGNPDCGLSHGWLDSQDSKPWGQSGPIGDWESRLWSQPWLAGQPRFQTVGPIGTNRGLGIQTVGPAMAGWTAKIPNRGANRDQSGIGNPDCGASHG